MWKTCRKLLTLAIALIASAPHVGKAQHWQKIYHFSTKAVVPYFVSDSIGFVYGAVSGNDIFNGGTSQGSGQLLARTLDGGNSWKQISLAGIFGDTGIQQGTIAHMSFTSPAHGYMAAQIDSSYAGNVRSLGGIFETNDTGSTWRMVLKGPACSDFYAVDSIVFAQGVYSYAHADSTFCFVSSDSGQHWSSIFLAYRYRSGNSLQGTGCVSGNRDSLILGNGLHYWTRPALLNLQRPFGAALPLCFLPHTRTAACIYNIMFNINGVSSDSTEIFVTHDAGLNSHVTYYSASDEVGATVLPVPMGVRFTPSVPTWTRSSAREVMNRRD